MIRLIPRLLALARIRAAEIHLAQTYGIRPASRKEHIRLLALREELSARLAHLRADYHVRYRKPGAPRRYRIA
jgi:hypothetical protein